MGSRRKGREVALQALYQVDVTEANIDHALRDFDESFETSPESRDFAWELVRGVAEKREEIDLLVAEVAENWRFDRLSRIDLTAIRIAVFEMMMSPELPVAIIIDEAVELAKRFGTADSSRFVNGVLDPIARRVRTSV